MKRGHQAVHPGLRGAAFLAALLALPAVSAAQSDQSLPIRVTVNHAAVISLHQNPGVALIANPDIADIVNDKTNLIFVLGRKPGATNLLIYDTSGQPLLNREIEVVPDTGNTVAITRETDVTRYYCEPHCVLYEHEGGVTTAPTAVSSGGAAAPGAQGANGGLPPGFQTPQAQPAPAAPKATP
jgi:hypothetical protein